MPPKGYIALALILTVVGGSLFLLRHLGRPLSIALCSGVLLTTIAEFIGRASQGTPIRQSSMLPVIAAGAGYGLFTFILFGAVIVVSALVRHLLNRHQE